MIAVAAGEPDLKNGFFQCADQWAEAFMSAPLTAIEHRLIWYILRNTYGNKVGRKPETRKVFRLPSINKVSQEIRSSWAKTRAAIARLTKSGVLVVEDGEVSLGKNIMAWKVWGRTAGPEFIPGVRTWERDGAMETALEPEGPTDANTDPFPTEVSPIPAAGLVLESKQTSPVPQPDTPIGESEIVPPLAAVEPAGPYAPSGVPKHDLLPDRPYTWSPQVVGDWWWQAHIPLPVVDVLMQAGPKAAEFVESLPDGVELGSFEYQEWMRLKVGSCGDRVAPKRWSVIWKAMNDCADNFATGSRKGLRSSKTDLIEPLWELLRKVRLDACVRLRDEDERPATLLRALARLRVLVAMVDSTDECSPFWLEKVKTVLDLKKHLESMLKQATQAEWREREDKLVAYWGS